MPQNYEIADFDTHTPFRCVVHHIGHIKSHMHNFFEILFVLSGSCSVMIDDQLSYLSGGDIIIVESHTLHELRASDCVYASVQLDQTTLENNFPVPKHPTFECNSTVPGKEQAYESLRRTIARMIKNNADEQSGYELRNWVLVYQLMDILYTYFRVERSEAVDKRSHRYSERISEISRIINAHFTEDLPLSRVADMVHLSVPYLSKFFMDQFGMNYLTYLTQLRINHAVHELINTEKNIEEISADSGFPNSHAFAQAFKKEYGMMPSAYRRKRKMEQTKDTVPVIEHSDYLANLRRYLEEPASPVPDSIPSAMHKGDFSVSGTKKKLTHTWSSVLSVGKAADILIADIQKIIRRAEEDIGFSYLFFNGIFSDELHVCTLDRNGRPVSNFVYVDQILDFLTDVGLKPFLSFSYMPRALAQKPDKILFGHLVSEPSSLSLWEELVEAFMKHVVARYGRNAVNSWRFTVWHQPNTDRRLYGFDVPESFFPFYRATRNIVKEQAPEAEFGFPAMFSNADDNTAGFYIDMLSWCSQNNCMPDFLNFTYYDTRLVTERNNSRSAFGFVYTMMLNPEPDGLRQFINRTRDNCIANDLKGIPVYVSEWNNTPSQQDLLNDTCYKSCFLVKNITENYDRLDSLSYWSLSDLMSEAPLPCKMLFGGLGLFTVNGLPKASYYALCLLKGLGDDFIAKGPGWFATKKDDEIRIIAFNYVHLSRLYASGEQFIMTDRNRYTMFDSAPPVTLTLDIRDTDPQKDYSVKEYLVGRQSGSLFDAWADMGAVDPENHGDLQILRAKSTPSLRQYTVKSADDGLKLSIYLNPLDVKLVIVS